MDLSKGDMVIFSGEGDEGIWERYYGSRTRRAILSRLTKERAHGDRWASVWIEEQETALMGDEDAIVYCKLDDDLSPTETLRSLEEDDIETDPASEAARALGKSKAGKPDAVSASRENGKRGGRPRKEHKE